MLMKKLSILKLFSLAAFAMSGAFALASVKGSEKAESVSAATVSGKLIAKLGNIGKWSQSSAKLTAYVYDSSHNAWLDLQTMSGDKEMYLFSYSLEFTPTNLIWVRMNPSESVGSWDTGKKWNQTGDLSFANATYLQDEWDPSTSQCSQWEVAADVKTSKDSFANPKVTFDISSVEIVNGNEPQVSGKVTLEKNEEFKVVNRADDTWSGFYDCPDALDSAFSGGSKEQLEGSGNIKCEIAGTYDFFFNTESKKIWISSQKIVDADGWASYFNSNVGCDDKGVSLPSGWSACATAYASLSNDAKDYVYGAEADASGDNLARALATYDYAVAHHPSLEKFIKNSSSAVRPSASISSEVFVSNTSESSNLIVIVSIVALISATSLVGLIVIKKRRSIAK